MRRALPPAEIQVLMAASPGVLLRDLREARGVSLDEIARATRVSRRHLEALEGDDWAELPGSVFVKGFIRGYCQHLGVAPDEVLAQYRQAAGEARSVAGPPPVAARAAARRRGGRPPVRTPVVVSGVLLVLLAAGLAVLTLGRQSPQEAPRPVAAVGEAPPVAAPALQAPDASVAVAPEPRSGETPSAGRPAPAVAPVAPEVPAAPGAPGTAAPRPDAGQNLVVKAVEPTWVRIQVDDEKPVQELLPTGATRRWVAERRFRLTVGNAGGLELELNGKRLPPLGERGAVIRELVLPDPKAGTGS